MPSRYLESCGTSHAGRAACVCKSVAAATHATNALDVKQMLGRPIKYDVIVDCDVTGFHRNQVFTQRKPFILLIQFQHPYVKAA